MTRAFATFNVHGFLHYRLYLFAIHFLMSSFELAAERAYVLSHHFSFVNLEIQFSFPGVRAYERASSAALLMNLNIVTSNKFRRKSGAKV